MQTLTHTTHSLSTHTHTHTRESKRQREITLLLPLPLSPSLALSPLSSSVSFAHLSSPCATLRGAQPHPLPRVTVARGAGSSPATLGIDLQGGQRRRGMGGWRVCECWGGGMPVEAMRVIMQQHACEMFQQF